MNYLYILEPTRTRVAIELPIVLNVGTQFETKTGTYKVAVIMPGVTDGTTYFLCDLIDNTQHLTEQLAKGRTFTYSKPVNT